MAPVGDRKQVLLRALNYCVLWPCTSKKKVLNLLRKTMNLTILTDYFVVKLLQFNILLQCNLGHFLDSLHFLTGFLCNLINDKHSVWLYAVKGPVKDL